MRKLLIIMASLLIAGLSHADEEAEIKHFLGELRAANKKSHWSDSLYVSDDWHVHGHSVLGRPLVYFECGVGNSNTTLMISTIHGDEITPTYFGLRLISWVKGEKDLCKDYHIVIAPLINPDGYLASTPKRINEHGIDLNRNFPTKDFDELANKIWKGKLKSDPRRNPGLKGGSEPETQFQQWLIDEFKPTKILSVHSPLNFYDYDGPEDDDFKTFTREYVNSCNQLRSAVKQASQNYKFMGYGFFPGSLGNYAGKERGIPTLTLELPTILASKAKGYFEQLKKGTKELVVYKIKEKPNAAPKEVKNAPTSGYHDAVSTASPNASSSTSPSPSPSASATP